MKKKLTLLAIIILLICGTIFFIQSSYFNVTSIRLSKSEQSDPRFDGFLGKNIFSISKEQILGELSSPRIYDCKLKKTYPNTIVVTPLYLEDYFLLKTKNYYTPLSKNKVVLEFQNYSPVPIINVNLPRYSLGDTIDNPKIDEIYSLYAEILSNDPEFAKLISEFFYDNGKLYFIKSNPINYICLGSGDILSKIKKLKSLEKSIDLKNKMIDLSFKKQLIYKELDSK